MSYTCSVCDKKSIAQVSFSMHILIDSVEKSKMFMVELHRNGLESSMYTGDIA